MYSLIIFNKQWLFSLNNYYCCRKGILKKIIKNDNYITYNEYLAVTIRKVITCKDALVIAIKAVDLSFHFIFETAKLLTFLQQKFRDTQVYSIIKKDWCLFCTRFSFCISHCLSHCAYSLSFACIWNTTMTLFLNAL